MQQQTNHNRQQQMFDFHYRVLLLGDARVGKTAFRERLMQDSFGGAHEYSSTIGIDIGVRDCLVNQFLCNVQCWDAAGRIEFRQLLTSYARQTHAVVLMFDATRRETFTALDSWAQFAANAANKSRIATLVIATHADDTQRVVSDDEARAFAAARGFTYGEFDARTMRQHDALLLLESLIVRLIDDDTDRQRLVTAAANAKPKRSAMALAFDNWRAKWFCGLVGGEFKM
jgi:small GTP-binding protein